jgi:hypothetical protein
LQSWHCVSPVRPWKWRTSISNDWASTRPAHDRLPYTFPFCSMLQPTIY